MYICGYGTYKQLNNRKFVINKFVILKIISLSGNIFYFTFT